MKDDEDPSRILGTRKNGRWYVAISSKTFAAGGSGHTYDEAFNEALQSFHEGRVDLAVAMAANPQPKQARKPKLTIV